MEIFMLSTALSGIILHIKSHTYVISIRYTYEVAPVFTLMEDAVLRKMIKVIGWEEGGDGIFNPGIQVQLYLCVQLDINKWDV